MVGQQLRSKPFRDRLDLILLTFCLSLIALSGQRLIADQARGQVIALEEVPVWTLSDEVRREFVRGQYVRCEERRAAGVTYPEFRSERPFFGSSNLQGVRSPSGEPMPVCFALDRAAGGDGDYDVLYIDQNGNRDLTDDSSLKPLEKAPEGILQGRSGTAQETCFASAKIPCDFGPAGVRPLELLPRFRVPQSGAGVATLYLVQAKVHRGSFTVAGQEYEAFLGYQFAVGGRLDKRGTALFLKPRGGNLLRWWGGDELNATHSFGGQLYRFSCSPTGDELTLRPYEGPIGTFELGAGGRDVTRLEMRGSLQAEETGVAVEDGSDATEPKATQKCPMPAGDYCPDYLTITFDDLQISVSNNYHTEDGQPRRGGPVMGIQIREDKPYILDFSNEPGVMFVHPIKGHRVRPGGELKVEAVLIDPPLDIMLRRLYRVSDTGKRVSLDPKVVIKRADGEVVAEGVMPFG